MRIIQKFLLALLCALIVSISWGSICLAQTTIQPPTAKDMLNDPTVIKAIDDAWEDSRINSYDNRHEEGGWIYQNTETGQMKVVRVAPGTRDLIEAPLPPPSEEGWRAVGFFHTHPSPPVDERGVKWEQGPSDTDIETAKKLGIPGIVRNRKGNEPFGPERGTYPPTQTTTLKPTDLTGTWRNPLSGQGYTIGWSPNPVTTKDIWYTDHYDVEWKVKQSGNTIAGYMTRTFVKRSGKYVDLHPSPKIGEVYSTYVTGTVEGTKITIKFSPDDPPLTGSFTGWMITAKWEGTLGTPATPGGPTPAADYYSIELSLSKVR